MPGSLARGSLAAIRFLKAQGLRVLIANVLMRQNADDYPAVRALAAELGVECTIDPTITPKMDGDRSIVSLRVSAPQLLRVFTDKSLIGDSSCEPIAAAADLRRSGCPAVQRRTHRVLHLAVRRRLSVRAVSAANRQRAVAAFRGDLEPLDTAEDVRHIRVRDLPTCSTCSLMSTCTRCPGLAYMEGNMRGPSSADCEKSQLRAGAATTAETESHEREGGLA